MRQKKNIVRELIALLLVLCMSSSFFSSVPVQAQEETGEVNTETVDAGSEDSYESGLADSEETYESDPADSIDQGENGETEGAEQEESDPADSIDQEESDETEDAGQEENGSEDSSDQEENDIADRLEMEEAPSGNSTEETGVLELFDDESGTPVTNETDAFQMQVTFAGKSLTANSANTIADAWSDTSPKMMQVVITRNKNVDVDQNKQYILCMKTSDVFYFNGLPDVTKITGAEEVTMLKNPTPKVKLKEGKEADLPSFSNYSGEIRVRLNTSVDTVTFENIAVSYNTTLVGYTGGAQTINNPLDIKLISAPADTALGSIGDSSTLYDYPVSSVQIKTEKVGGGLRTFYSMDDFQTQTYGTKANLSVNDGISFFIGSNDQKIMVYKDLTYVLHIPYIKKDGVEHYLSFSTSDMALTSNRKGSRNGYILESPATYNAEEHTITYSFKNVYMTSWDICAYTPTFYWPEGLDKNITEEYIIYGYKWDVTEKKCYTDAESSFTVGWTSKSGTPNNTTDKTAFLADSADIILRTNVDAGPTVHLAVPKIYKDVSREKGNTGFLGFFDVHNEGAGDSPEVQVDIEFNTDNEKKAKYYVTQMQLPADRAGTEVSYTLVDDEGNIVKGTYKYSYTSSFACKVSTLRDNSKVNGEYYIKSLSYKTVLRRNKMYHNEVTHSYRNSLDIPGVYQGYIEGEVGEEAAATMKITAAETGKTITKDGKNTLSTTEISTVSDLDFVSTGITAVTVDGGTSTSISAGTDTTLKFNVSVGSDEYGVENGPDVNGYHILRDGIFYVCLPENVSISGTDNVEVKISDSSIRTVTGVTRLETTKCTINNLTAYWWAIEVDGLNLKARTANISVTLATSKSMAGLNWSFNNCIAVRSKDQQISKTSTSTTYVANTKEKLLGANTPGATALAGIFTGQETDLGLNLYRANSSVNLNIVRAEAKLDVKTSLATPESDASGAAVTLSESDKSVTYHVEVSCSEEGVANNFSYYIPIVHTDSTLDTSALVEKKEISFRLAEAVTVAKDNSAGEAESLPFEVSYTTDKNLNSTSIQGNAVHWKNTYSEEDDITAVRITTIENASVNQGEKYQFSVVMKYRGDDFDRQAGSIAAWRSFGHYTYTRNGATTTNSYPSPSNSVRIRYVKDMTADPVTAALNTAADNNSVDVSQKLSTTFVRNQKLGIKSVTPSSGTILSAGDPGSLTGAAANSNFKINFKLNESASYVTLPAAGNGWQITKDTEISMKAIIWFSKALTDVTTERYIDIVLGNDDIDIKCRIKLERTVAAASADGSGLALGEQFQVPQVQNDCSISKDSAFTALYVIKNFVPGNYDSQLLKWQNSNGTPVAFPSETTITMMEVDADSKVTGYWYCRPSGSSVNLKDFTRMAGSGTYSYDTSATSSTTLRYMFVVNFGQADAAEGNYQLVFDAAAKEGASSTAVALSVTLGATKTYGLSSATTPDMDLPAAKVSYNVTESGGNDSYSEGRSLALVLTPEDGTSLPQDAGIKYGNSMYTCNSQEKIIFPLGTVATGSVDLTLISGMFPATEQTYSFYTELYLSNSSHGETPGDGKKVATGTVSFKKSAETSPALKVTGTQIAAISDWASGQPIKINMNDLKSEDCTVTVTAYSGVSGGSQVTDLLSSVPGFTIKNGVGTYNKENTEGKLKLSSVAAPGTYRLVFQAKKGNELLLTVPYYIIVQ